MEEKSAKDALQELSDFGQEMEKIMKRVTRLEVIDETGRAYVKYMKDESIHFSLQDDDRTLKIFIDDWDKVEI